MIAGHVVWVNAGTSSRGDSHKLKFSAVLTFLHSDLQQKGQGKSRSHYFTCTLTFPALRNTLL